MKTKISLISTLFLALTCITMSQVTFAGNASKRVASGGGYDNVYDGLLAYVEPVNGYISYYANLSCSSDQVSSAEIILWGDFPGYQADVHVPDNGNTSKSTSGVVYPSSTQGGWIEATFFLKGYASADLNVNW